MGNVATGKHQPLVHMLRLQQRLRKQPNGEDSGLSILCKNAADAIEFLIEERDEKNALIEKLLKDFEDDEGIDM